MDILEKSMQLESMQFISGENNQKVPVEPVKPRILHLTCLTNPTGQEAKDKGGVITHATNTAVAAAQ